MGEDRMAFYEFDQNNSGGSFDIDDARGIGPKVWIEATDLVCAVSIAFGLGIYFDGVSKGIDCGCCGDRWSAPWSNNEKATPEIDDKYDFGWHDAVYVHRLNGEIQRVHRIS